MKASELIKELEKQISENGDCDIYIESLSDSGNFSIINNVKLCHEIYDGKWNPETQRRSTKQDIFLLGQNGYGEFSDD